MDTKSLLWYTVLSSLTLGYLMVAGVSLHRRLGHWLIWTFSGTMVTAYLLYLMLFVWFPSS